jgi:hypothetical protein
VTTKNSPVPQIRESAARDDKVQESGFPERPLFGWKIVYLGGLIKMLRDDKLCHPGAKQGGPAVFLNRLLHLEQRGAAGVKYDGVVG